jgi:hypothetical protein
VRCDEWYWTLSPFLTAPELVRVALLGQTEVGAVCVWLERQAKLKPGDKALFPLNPSGWSGSAIKFRYDWPYEDMYIASVEYLDELILLLRWQQTSRYRNV